MSTTIQRTPLTDLLLAQLKTTGFAVGDGQMPDAGWIGKPMATGAVFAPFLVLAEIVASHSSGSLADDQSEWQLPYLVESFGITREQCSRLAERARAALDEMQQQLVDLGDAPYRIALVRTDSLGQPGRVDSTDPKFWHSQDGVTFWLMKGSY